MRINLFHEETTSQAVYSLSKFYLLSRSVHMALRLNLHLIMGSEPLQIDEIVNAVELKTGIRCQRHTLARLMRFLACFQWFELNDFECFQSGPLLRALSQSDDIENVSENCVSEENWNCVVDSKNFFTYISSISASDWAEFMSEMSGHLYFNKEDRQSLDLVAGDPLTAIKIMSRLYLLARSIYIAARSDIVEKIHCSDTATETKLLKTKNPITNERLLQVLMVCGLLDECEEELTVTSWGKVLLPDTEESMHACLCLVDAFWWRAAGNMLYTLKQGKPAFNSANGNDGLAFWQYLKSNPSYAKLFHDGMANISIKDDRAAYENFNWNDYDVVIDIAGGRAGLLNHILLGDQNSSIEAVLYENNDVIAASEDLLVRDFVLSSRCQLVSGNFFQSFSANNIPCASHYPDKKVLYILKGVLHDFDDVKCRIILEHIREAMGDHNQTELLIIERSLPEPSKPHENYYSDILMLLLLTGWERSDQDWMDLLCDSSFRWEPFDNVVIGNAGAFRLLRSQPSQNFHPCEVFMQQVRQYSDHPALFYKEKDVDISEVFQKLTYDQLYRLAVQLAYYLIDNLGVKPKDWVTILVGRHQPYIAISLWATWMVGAVPVPMELSASTLKAGGIRARLSQMANGQSLFLITEQYCLEAMEQAGYTLSEILETINNRICNLTDKATQAAIEKIEMLTPGIHETDLPWRDVDLSDIHSGYVMCSSGTTGEPKIILNALEGLYGRVMGHAQRLGVGSASGILGFGGYIYDPSLMEMILAWYRGASLSLVPESVRENSDNLLPFLQQAKDLGHPVTVAIMTPSVLDMLDPVACHVAGINAIVTMGEKCHQMTLQKWHNAGVVVWNGYGPTETTICGTMDKIIPSYPMSMARSFPGVSIRIIDVEFQDEEKTEYRLIHGNEITENSKAGMLVISGDGVGAYWRNDLKNRHQFYQYDYGEGVQRYFVTEDLVHWEGKSLIFETRIGGTVKRLGQLVNLGEMEELLKREDTPVSSVAMIKKTLGRHQVMVIAYLLSHKDYDDSEFPQALYEYMAKHLADESDRFRPSFCVRLMTWPPGDKTPYKALKNIDTLLQYRPKLIVPPSNLIDERDKEYLGCFRRVKDCWQNQILSGLNESEQTDLFIRLGIQSDEDFIPDDLHYGSMGIDSQKISALAHQLWHTFEDLSPYPKPSNFLKQLIAAKTVSGMTRVIMAYRKAQCYCVRAGENPGHFIIFSDTNSVVTTEYPLSEGAVYHLIPNQQTKDIEYLEAQVYGLLFALKRTEPHGPYHLNAVDLSGLNVTMRLLSMLVTNHERIYISLPISLVKKAKQHAKKDDEFNKLWTLVESLEQEQLVYFYEDASNIGLRFKQSFNIIDFYLLHYQILGKLSQDTLTQNRSLALTEEQLKIISRIKEEHINSAKIVWLLGGANSGKSLVCSVLLEELQPSAAVQHNHDSLIHYIIPVDLEGKSNRACLIEHVETLGLTEREISFMKTHGHIIWLCDGYDGMRRHDDCDLWKHNKLSEFPNSTLIISSQIRPSAPWELLDNYCIYETLPAGYINPSNLEHDWFVYEKARETKIGLLLSSQQLRRLNYYGFLDYCRRLHNYAADGFIIRLLPSRWEVQCFSEDDNAKEYRSLCSSPYFYFIKALWQPCVDKEGSNDTRYIMPDWLIAEIQAKEAQQSAKLTNTLDKQHEIVDLSYISFPSDLKQSGCQQIQGGYDRYPIWLMPPITGGLPNQFKQLATYLPSQPIYGLQFPHNYFDEIIRQYGEDVVHNIKFKAIYLVQVIKQWQLVGPYLLGGWSFGSALAYEVALLLESMGDEVACVFNFDGVIPLEMCGNELAYYTADLVKRLGNIYSVNNQDQLNKIMNGLSSLGTKYTSFTERKAFMDAWFLGLNSYFKVNPCPEFQAVLRQVHSHMLSHLDFAAQFRKHYRDNNSNASNVVMQRCQTDIIIFTAKETIPCLTENASWEEWESLFKGEFLQVPVAGNHFTLFENSSGCKELQRALRTKLLHYHDYIPIEKLDVRVKRYLNHLATLERGHDSRGSGGVHIEPKGSRGELGTFELLPYLENYFLRKKDVAQILVLYGAGKNYTARYLANQLADELISNRYIESSLFPLYVDLRLNQRLSIYTALIHHNFSMSEIGMYFRQKVPLLLILDGVGELTAVARDDLLASLPKWCNHPHTKVVITCKSSLLIDLEKVLKSRLDSTGIQHDKIELPLLDDEQIKEYELQYYKSHNFDIPSHNEVVCEQLKQLPALYELLRNPLLLSIILQVPEVIIKWLSSANSLQSLQRARIQIFKTHLNKLYQAIKADIINKIGIAAGVNIEAAFLGYGEMLASVMWLEGSLSAKDSRFFSEDVDTMLAREACLIDTNNKSGEVQFVHDCYRAYYLAQYLLHQLEVGNIEVFQQRPCHEDQLLLEFFGGLLQELLVDGPSSYKRYCDQLFSLTRTSSDQKIPHGKLERKACGVNNALALLTAGNVASEEYDLAETNGVATKGTAHSTTFMQKESMPAASFNTAAGSAANLF